MTNTQPAAGTTAEFRRYLFPADHPRITEVKGLDAYAYREFARKEGTFTGELIRVKVRPPIPSTRNSTTCPGATDAPAEIGALATISIRLRSTMVRSGVPEATTFPASTDRDAITPSKGARSVAPSRPSSATAT